MSDFEKRVADLDLAMNTVAKQLVRITEIIEKLVDRIEAIERKLSP